MRLKRLSIKGVLAYPELVTVDFEAMPAGIYAVWGKNGAGKTTLVECIPAVPFREFPSRDRSLVDYALRRDAFLELDMAMGDEDLRARLSLDPQSRGSDAVLSRIVDGVATPINDGKVKTYDAAIQKRFPPLSQLLASAFGIQSRKGSFVGLSQSGRKDLFQRLIGADRYAKLAEASKSHRDAARATASAAAEAYEALKATATDDQIEEAEGQRIGALARIWAGEASIRKYTADLETASAELQTAVAAVKVLDAEVVTSERERTEYKNACAAVDRLTAQLTTLTDQRQKATVAAGDALTQRVKDLERVLAATPTVDTVAQESVDAIALIKSQHAWKQTQCSEKIAEIEKELEAEPAARVAADNLVQLKKLLATTQDSLKEAAARGDKSLAALLDLTAAHGKSVSDDERVERLRQTIQSAESVPCHGAAPFDSCRFLTDVADAKERLAKRKPSRTAELETAIASETSLKKTINDNIQALQLSADRHREQMSVLEPEAEKLSDLKVAAQRRVDLQRTLASLDDDMTNAIQAELAKASERRDERLLLETRVAEDITLARQMTEESIKAIHVDWELQHDEVRDAREVESQTVRRLEGNETAWDSVAHRLWEAQQQSTVALTKETMLTKQLRAAELDLTAHKIVHSNALHSLQMLEAARAKAREWEQAVVQRQQEASEWEQLLRAFGRDGLPTIEIDAAGPSVTSHANHLLAGVVGGRFSVQLVTQAPTTDGKGLKDIFDIQVFDGDKGGAVRTINDLSGGQQTILDEVLKSAIALFMNAQNIQPIRTCIRDETTSSLHKDVIPDYVQLLRNVRSEGGFEHLLYITHDLDAAVAADGILWCHDGQIHVCYPPYNVPALEADTPTKESV